MSSARGSRLEESLPNNEENTGKIMASQLSTSRYGRAHKPAQYDNMRSEWSSDATSDDGDDSDEDGDSVEEEELDGGNESDYEYEYDEYDPLDQTEGSL